MMDINNKILQLKSKISESLLPLIGEKCALYDVPYYKNIGDVLIWQGELDFLQSNNRRIVDMASYKTCKYPILDKDVTILFQGGGNIGDLYHEHVDFLISLTKKYPLNRIIVFSQTVYYKNKSKFLIDLNILKGHPNLYFVARDGASYELVYSVLEEKTLLLPDMAFCVDRSLLSGIGKKIKISNEKLFIKRRDVESNNNIVYAKKDIKRDWPVFEQPFRRTTIINTLLDRLFNLFVIRVLITNLWNSYAFSIFRVNMIKEGVCFVYPYKYVSSERLHGAILAILLNKEVEIVDNSYGKNRNFYISWLSDVDGVTLQK